MNIRNVALGAAALLAAPAMAQINPIGLFTGDASESFNGLPQGVFVSQFPNLFDGSVNANAIGGGQGLHATTGWGFFNTIFARSGLLIAGAGVNIEWQFTTPVMKVGGYFGTNADVPNGLIYFYDVNGNQIGPAMPITAPNQPQNNVEWAWNGWESTGPAIAWARVFPNHQWVGHLMHEDMEISFGGAPPCDADWNGDGQVDFFDYLDFVQDFNDDNADYNRDGQTDFFDYLDFVADFDAGCD